MRYRRVGDRCGGRRGCNSVDVHVSERQDSLQRHRSKRQPTCVLPFGSNPMHRVILPLHVTLIAKIVYCEAHRVVLERARLGRVASF